MTAKDRMIQKFLLEGILTVDPIKGKVYGRYDLVGSVTKAGYLRSSVRYANRRYFFMIHRVIWISQNGTVPDGLQLDHINGVKLENGIANLELVTDKENKRRYRER